jgi:hypothetical protein
MFDKRTLHHVAVFLAIFVGIALLCGMLFGGGRSKIQDYIGLDRSIRDISVALWSFLLPSWYTIEANFFAPVDEKALIDFHRNQSNARYFWTVMGGAVAIIIGVSAPPLSQQPQSGGSTPAITAPQPSNSGNPTLNKP